MFKHKTPNWIQNLFPKLTWCSNGDTKTIYLTFDDGPVPEATPAVLNYLKEYGAQATFFCVGANMAKHPGILEDVLNEGHRVGNHTENHLDGWRCSKSEYLENVQICQERIDGLDQTQAKPLMRPPYGRIKLGQAQSLLTTHEVVMWDVLSGDFAPNVSPIRCLQKTQSLVKQGSIVVFHDSLKTINKLNFVLPKMLRYFSEQGFTFKVL